MHVRRSARRVSLGIDGTVCAGAARAGAAAWPLLRQAVVHTQPRGRAVHVPLQPRPRAARGPSGRRRPVPRSGRIASTSTHRHAHQQRGRCTMNRFIRVAGLAARRVLALASAAPAHPGWLPRGREGRVHLRAARRSRSAAPAAPSSRRRAHPRSAFDATAPQVQSALWADPAIGYRQHRRHRPHRRPVRHPLHRHASRGVDRRPDRAERDRRSRRTRTDRDRASSGRSATSRSARIPTARRWPTGQQYVVCQRRLLDRLPRDQQARRPRHAEPQGPAVGATAPR